MAGKFELYKDAKFKFRFRHQAWNGEIIAVAEAYETKANANAEGRTVNTSCGLHAKPVLLAQW